MNKKKLFILLTAFLILFNFTTREYVQAAVVSKVASTVAKQMAKVPVKDITKDVAFEIAQQAIAQNFNATSTYKFEENYAGYCVTEIKADGTCSKMMQIKKDLTVEDMRKIDSQVEVEFDKAITSGKGFTRWQKILDWFVPIWLASAAYTAITFAMDGDVRDLFNEIAYNTLVALGIIKPVLETDKAMPIDQIDLEEPSTDTPETNSDTIQTKQSPGVSTIDYLNPSLNVRPYVMATEDVAVEMKIDTKLDVKTLNINSGYKIGSGTKPFPVANMKTGQMYIDKQLYGNAVPMLSIAVNGNVVAYNDNNLEVWEGYYDYEMTPRNINLGQYLDTTISVVRRVPYQIDNYWYSDIMYTNKYGDKVSYQLRTATKPNYDGEIHEIYETTKVSEVGGLISTTLIIHKNLKLEKAVQIPAYVDVPLLQQFDKKTVYENEAGNIAFVPPTAIPYTDSETGETLTRTPNADPTQEPIFTRPDGTIVPEDKITVGEPNVTTTPDGTPIVTPVPTAQNPNPDPIPLTPAPNVSTPENPTGQPTTDPNNPTEPTSPPPTSPGDTGEPYEPLPEGEKCDAKLKFPIFSPLKEQLQTSFPFSIPWDIGRAIEAAFGDIGTKKPEFNLDVAFMGDTKTITITTPKLFDDWKPFTDSLLIFTFDVLIMFGVYRFVKGAGS